MDANYKTRLPRGILQSAGRLRAADERTVATVVETPGSARVRLIAACRWANRGGWRPSTTRRQRERRLQSCVFHHARRAGYHDALPTRAARRQKWDCAGRANQTQRERLSFTCLHHGSCSCSSALAVAEQSAAVATHRAEEEKKVKLMVALRSSTLIHWSTRRCESLWCFVEGPAAPMTLRCWPAARPSTSPP